MAQFKFKKDSIEKLKKACEEELRRRVDNATDELIDVYLDEVGKFYSEYTPQVYDRHSFNSIEKSGMARTFQRLPRKEYWDGKRFVVESGITINTYKMWQDYLASIRYGHTDWVLYSFTQGYHGLPIPSTYRGSLRILDDMHEYVEEVINPKFAEKIDLTKLKV